MDSRRDGVAEEETLNPAKPSAVDSAGQPGRVFDAARVFVNYADGKGAHIGGFYGAFKDVQAACWPEVESLRAEVEQLRADLGRAWAPEGARFPALVREIQSLKAEREALSTALRVLLRENKEER